MDCFCLTISVWFVELLVAEPLVIWDVFLFKKTMSMVESGRRWWEMQCWRLVCQECNMYGGGDCSYTYNSIKKVFLLARKHLSWVVSILTIHHPKNWIWKIQYPSKNDGFLDQPNVRLHDLLGAPFWGICLGWQVGWCWKLYLVLPWYKKGSKPRSLVSDP